MFSFRALSKCSAKCRRALSCSSYRIATPTMNRTIDGRSSLPEIFLAQMPVPQQRLPEIFGEKRTTCGALASASIIGGRRSGLELPGSTEFPPIQMPEPRLSELDDNWVATSSAAYPAAAGVADAFEDALCDALCDALQIDGIQNCWPIQASAVISASPVLFGPKPPTASATASATASPSSEGGRRPRRDGSTIARQLGQFFLAMSPEAQILYNQAIEIGLPKLSKKQLLSKMKKKDFDNISEKTKQSNLRLWMRGAGYRGPFPAADGNTSAAAVTAAGSVLNSIFVG